MERLNVLRLAVSAKPTIMLLITIAGFAVFTFKGALTWNLSSKPMLGIVYDYYYDETFTITNELERMKADGFQILCIFFYWNENPQDPIRIKTNLVLEKAKQLGMQIYLRQPWNAETLKKYLSIYGDKIDYVQVINEADIVFLKEWYVTGQVAVIAEANAKAAKTIKPNIKTVATFATPIIPNLITDIASHVDIIGLDIYEQIQLDTLTMQIQTLKTLSSKRNIWIGEFGYATLNDQEQADFFNKGLNLLQKNCVEAIIIWRWNWDDTGLSIKNRPAETIIKNWAANP